jgi:hypothetical protein
MQHLAKEEGSSSRTGDPTRGFDSFIQPASIEAVKP